MDFVRKKVLHAVTLSCLALGGTSSAQNTSSNTYDTRGTKSEVIASLDSLTNNEFSKQKSGIIYQYDMTDKHALFEPVPSILSYNEKIAFVQAIEANFKILSDVDTKAYEDVNENERKLKELMLALQELQDPTSVAYIDNALLQGLEMYRIITVKTSEIHKKDVMWTANILRVFHDQQGDCTEFTALYYSLLNYYGVNSYFKIGTVSVGERRPINHTWLHLKIGEYSFDLDPRNMGEPIPLKERNPESIPALQVTEYHTKRFH